MQVEGAEQDGSPEPTMLMGPPLQARGNDHMTRCNITHCKVGLDCSVNAYSKAFFSRFRV